MMIAWPSAANKPPSHPICGSLPISHDMSPVSLLFCQSYSKPGPVRPWMQHRKRLMVLPRAEARAPDPEVDGVPDMGRSVWGNEVRDHVVGQHHVAWGAQDALWILRAQDFFGAVAGGERSVALLAHALQAFRSDMQSRIVSITFPEKELGFVDR